MMRERQFLQYVVLGKLNSYKIKNEIEYFLKTYTKINSKWIKELNLRPGSIKLLEENIGRTLFDINQSKIFSNPAPRVMKRETKIYKQDLIKFKCFCTAKETINKKGNCQNVRKYLQKKQLTSD